MTEEGKKRALIVEQVPAISDPLQATLRILAAKHGVDLYTTRQRLLGGGLTHFGSGAAEEVEKIAALLEAVNLKTWIITPTRPLFEPQNLRSLEIRGEQILFTTPQGTISMARGDRAIGVLADISGSVVDKQLKRIMAHNIYQGSADNARLDGHEIRRTILLGKPVYDLYLISDENRVRACIRALPSKFDHTGLGDLATLSATGNLDALIRLTENFSENFTLQTGFGLSQLPGCRLQKAGDGSDWQLQNLKNVVRFGWLMTDLALQPQTHRPESPPVEGPSVGTVAAATMLGRPELAASNALREMPGIGAVIDAIDQAIAEGDQGAGAPEEKVDKRLPLPPEPRHRTLSWRVLAVNISVVTAIGLFYAFFRGSPVPGQLLHYGFNVGLFYAIGALGLFWGGINFFLLKRQIENTPTSKIRSLAMGMVEIHGQARRKYGLVSLMTQTPCVYYRLRTYRRDDKNNWRLKSESDSGHVPFFIEDATGRVTVDPFRATIRAGVKQEGFQGQGNILFSERGAYDENEKWVEEIIHEGSPLYVLGDAQLQKQERPSLREKKIEKLRDLKLDRAAMRKYDVDGDGRISADEWQAAGEDVEEQLLRDRLAEEHVAARQEDYIVIRRSKHRSHPFVIAATESEAHLTRNYGLVSILMLFSSLLLGSWALYKILGYFGIS